MMKRAMSTLAVLLGATTFVVGLVQPAKANCCITCSSGKNRCCINACVKCSGPCTSGGCSVGCIK